MSKKLVEIGQFDISGVVYVDRPDGTTRRSWKAIVNLTPSLGFRAAFGGRGEGKQPDVAIHRAAVEAVSKARNKGKEIAS